MNTNDTNFLIILSVIKMTYKFIHSSLNDGNHSNNKQSLNGAPLCDNTAWQQKQMLIIHKI